MKVMVFGTFDILHQGHLDFFRQAKQHGDELVVVVARDSTVEEVKGIGPLNSQAKRLKAVKRSGLADKAVLGHRWDKYRVIEEEQPGVVCLGYDQDAFTANLEEELRKRGLEPGVVRLQPYKPETYKSSKIKESIKNK